MMTHIFHTLCYCGWRLSQVMWAITRALVLLSFLLIGLMKPAAAQAAYCWIDAQTGQAVPTVPAGGVNQVGAATLNAGAAQIDPTNPNRATNSRTGRIYIRQPDGSWIDAQTGQAVPTVPAGGVNQVGAATLNAGAVQIDPANPNRATNSRTGKTYVRVPCPPPQTAASTGLYIGGELVKNWGWVRSTERLVRISHTILA
jgi:hypothetical protein